MAFVKMRDSVSFYKQILNEYVLKDSQKGQVAFIYHHRMVRALCHVTFYIRKSEVHRESRQNSSVWH